MTDLETRIDRIERVLFGSNAEEIIDRLLLDQPPIIEYKPPPIIEYKPPHIIEYKARHRGESDVGT